MSKGKYENLTKEGLPAAETHLRHAETLIDRGKYRQGASQAILAVYDLTTALLLTSDVTAKSLTGLIHFFQRRFVAPGLFSESSADILVEIRNARRRMKGEASFPSTEPEGRRILNRAKDFYQAVTNFATKTLGLVTQKYEV